ncbi:MAG: DUF5131 family protein [Phycisphaerae bacterium]|nr:DUF5131 family protein [Phycisphaerae bacterium]
MSDTKIEWCHKTWNPITGCGNSVISVGCERCYARRAAEGRFLRGRYGYDQVNPFQVTFHPDRLDKPLHWRKPRRVFVNSMGDLHHEDVPYEWLHRVYRVMEKTPRHTYLVLTKRPDHVQVYLPVGASSNVWLAVTVEDQRRADERVPTLLEIDAAVRFVSFEPLLESIANPPPKIDWAIIGPETGPGRRICRPEWMRGLIEYYSHLDVPIFVKAFPLPDGRISKNMADWPEWARRREFPKAPRVQSAIGTPQEMSRTCP